MSLRSNNPDQTMGMTSLGLLDPSRQSPSSSSHSRKASNATFISSTDSEGDHLHPESGLRHVKSNATSVTHVDTHSTSSKVKDPAPISPIDEADKKKKKKKKKGEPEPEEELKTTHQLELAQDETIDPKPFDFKPYELAHMLDPKSIDVLTGFNGITGLLHGLGTNADTGLSKAALQRALTFNEKTGDDRPGAGTGASPNHEPGGRNDEKVPEITLTEPGGAVRSASDEGPAFRATLEDRKRVYGENVLPQRTSKSLLQLMWMALKDKVLVRTLRPSLICC